MHYVLTHLKRKMRRRRRLLNLMICLLALALGISILNRPHAVSKLTEDQRLVKEIGDHLLLPNEVPSIATVSDISVLTDQPFFRSAKNGDKLLLYKTSNKAILYDPVAKKVIEVGTLESWEIMSSPEETGL